MAWNTSDQRCSPLFEPDFYEDPDAYFDYWEGCAGDVPSLPDDPWLPPCRPRTWRDPKNLRCWQLICTSHGPEIRPCPGEPTIVDVPQVVALQLRSDGFGVLVATEEGERLQMLTVRQAKKIGLGKIAGAMVNGSKLPADDLKRVPANFWTKQKRLRLPPVELRPATSPKRG